MLGDGRSDAERVRRLHDEVRAVIGECMEAVSAELTFFTLPNCFELFGFDLLVDCDWCLWLLEANAEPDFLQVCLTLLPLDVFKLTSQSVMAGRRGDVYGSTVGHGSGASCSLQHLASCWMRDLCHL